MKELNRGVCALLVILLSGTAARAAVPADLGRRALEGYIRPATGGLVIATRGLAASLADYCAQPAGNGRRQTVDRHFAELAFAWSRVELLRFGPLVEHNRFERFFFFPDPRGVTLRQVQVLLAAVEPQRIEPAALRADSVALQGIPALEYALYGDNAAARIEADAVAGRYRCRYAQVITHNLQLLATELQTAWMNNAPAAREFSAPGPTRSTYRSQQEIATELLKALSTGLQYTRDSKLLPALGADVDSARVQRAPLWRSGLTTSALAANLRGLLALYEASGLGTTLAGDQRWIDSNVRGETAAAAGALEAIALPFEQAIADERQRARIVYAALVIGNLHSIVVEHLAPALEVKLGFNALDGD